MRKKNRRFLRYFFYAGLATAMTTTSLFAVRGRCHYVQDSKEVFAACDCTCEHKWRDKKEPLYCKKCHHQLKPTKYIFVSREKRETTVKK